MISRFKSFLFCSKAPNNEGNKGETRRNKHDTSQQISSGKIIDKLAARRAELNQEINDLQALAQSPEELERRHGVSSLSVALALVCWPIGIMVCVVTAGLFLSEDEPAKVIGAGGLIVGGAVILISTIATAVACSRKFCLFNKDRVEKEIVKSQEELDMLTAPSPALMI